MNIAREVATRSTCSRKHVGAVIVRDKTILSTGYNGSIKGLPHCDDAGCEMVDGHCVRTSHAEANAIVQAAKNGVGIDQSKIYVTASPCYDCFKLIANAGINIEMIATSEIRTTCIVNADDGIKALNEVHSTLIEYPTMAGVYDWEYLDAPPNKEDPSQWATLMKRG